MSRYVGYYVYECDAPLCGETGVTSLNPNTYQLPQGWVSRDGKSFCSKHKELASE